MEYVRTASFPNRSVAAVLLAVLAALPLSGREKDVAGAGLIVNVPFPIAQVTPVVQDIVQNGIIRGTKEYNKDEYISGANPATSTPVFARWTESGRVFYKVRLKALDPRNFKDSSDVGTLAVRYVIQPQGEKNTVLRIDARFVEDFRRSAHASNGSVEGAEYKEIHDRLEALELMRTQTIEAEKEKQKRTSQAQPPFDSAPAALSSAKPEAGAVADASAGNLQSPPQTLEVRIRDLRQQVQRRIKAPGTPLQSAPFHTAATLQSLPAGTEVLIVVSTRYWFGVETHEGQHGWIMRDQLEEVP